MRRCTPVVEVLERRQLLCDYYVSPLGDDAAAGDVSAPFKTLQQAADIVVAGDTVHVLAGTYTEGVNFFGRAGGTAINPIRFLAESGVLITHCATSGTNSSLAAINVENAGDWYIIQGFHIVSDGSMERAGIRVSGSNNTQILNNTIDRAYMGIFTSHADNLLVQGNTCINSTGQHGIYMSGAEHNAVVRGNFLSGNTWDGLHMNIVDGEPDTPNDGALVENNIIYDNSLSGIDMQGTTNARFQNNVIFGNAKHGITIHNLDQPNTPPCTGNVFVNNTIVGNDMFAVQMAAGGNTANTFFNNILYSASGIYGSIGVSGPPTGLVSDYNAVVDNFSMDLGFSRMDLSQWQALSGQDLHSFVSDPTQLFLNPSGVDFYLKPGSAAIDRGMASFASASAPISDFDGTPRPFGLGPDIGAYEWFNDTVTPSISDLAISGIKSTRVVISWNTTERATAQVEYGVTADYGITIANPWMWTAHTLNLSGLAPGTVYHFRAVSIDRAGNVVASEDMTFTTLPPDLTPPVISAIVVSNITPVSATITWSTDEGSDSRVSYGNSPGHDSSITDGTLQTIHQLNLTGLDPQTPYHFRVWSADESGNLSGSRDFTFETPVAGGLPPGAAAYWSFREITGTKTADASGNGHAGVLRNGATFAAGQTGGGLSVDGIDDSVRIPRSADLEPAQVSVSAWIKLAPGTQSDWATIIKKVYKDDTDALGASYSLSLSPEGRSNIVCFFTASIYGGHQLNSPFAIPTGQWVHVAGTYDPATGQKLLYVDGVQVASATLDDPIAYDPTSTGDIYLGQDPGVGEAYRGLIDGVGVWGRVLTPAEVASLAYPAAITLRPAPGSNTFYLRLDPTGTVLQVWHNVPASARPTQSFPLASAGPIIIRGSTGDDAVVLDLSNGSFIGSGGLQFDGGGHLQGDSLQIVGAGRNNGSYQPGVAVSGSGLLTVDGQNIVFRNVQLASVANFSTLTLATAESGTHLFIEAPVRGRFRVIGSSGVLEIVPLECVDIAMLVLGTTANGSIASDVITSGVSTSCPTCPTVAADPTTAVAVLAGEELAELTADSSVAMKALGDRNQKVRIRMLATNSDDGLGMGINGPMTQPAVSAHDVSLRTCTVTSPGPESPATISDLSYMGRAWPEGDADTDQSTPARRLLVPKKRGAASIGRPPAQVR